MQLAPLLHTAARWSLALGAVSLLLLVWLLFSVRTFQRSHNSVRIQQALNDQAAMAKLLDEMAPLASGDLAVKASASDGTVGALADAFNSAIGELQRLAGMQLSVSRTLGESVSRSHGQAVAIADQCAHQTGYIHKSSNLLLAMSSSTGALSANAAQISIAAQSMVDEAEALSVTQAEQCRQIDNVQQDADISYRLIQSLEHYAQSIDDIIAPLIELAQCADLLAVNATIHSLSATGNEASAEVTRLSEEVAILVRALRRATDDVVSLTNSIRTGSSEATPRIKRLRAVCHVRSTRASDWMNSLEKMRTHAQYVHDQTRQMAAQSVQHAGVVNEVSQKMNLISQIAEKAGRDAHTSAGTVDELKKLASDLRQSTSDFNLPGSHVAVPGRHKSNSFARRAADRAAING